MTNRGKNDKIISMLALSEEINALNFKLQELIKDLNIMPETHIDAKGISDTLYSKVNDINNNIKGFEPPKNKDTGQRSIPSYESEGVEQTFTSKFNNPDNVPKRVKKSTELKKNNKEVKKQTKTARPPKGISQRKKGPAKGRSPLGNSNKSTIDKFAKRGKK